MNRIPVVVLLFVSQMAGVVPAQAADKFSYSKENTFTEKDSCIGSGPGTSLAPKEKFRRFLMKGPIESGRPPFSGEVSHIISAAKAKEKLKISIIMTSNVNPLYDGHVAYWEAVKEAEKDKPLWAEIGCFHTLDANNGGYETLARLTPEYKYSMGVAIRGLPANAWVIQGQGETISMYVKNNPYVELVRHLVTDACYAPDSRIEASRSSMLNGHSILHLVIGKAKKVSPEKRKLLIEKEIKERLQHYVPDHPTLPQTKKRLTDEIEGKDFFESVEICRFFLDGKRVLKSDTFSHASGVDKDWGHEVQLDSGDWPYLRENILGFISLDEGENWDIVKTTSGMESSSYWILSLDSSSTERFSGGLTQMR